MELEIKENLQSLLGVLTIWNDKILRSLEISKCETLKKTRTVSLQYTWGDTIRVRPVSLNVK